MLSQSLTAEFPRRLLLLLINSAMICGLVVLASGCDQIAGIPVVQVIGEVRMNRKPLTDTMVAFIPLELRGGNQKIIEIAFGRTDSSGKFELRTSASRGVAPGEYRVLFYGPNPATENSAQIDDEMEIAESTNSGIHSDTSWMLAAIDSLDASAQATQQPAAMVDVGGVPKAYNIRSGLRLTVNPGAGIIYPKFELDAHPKN